jgi:CBS domain-containing protein
MRARDLATPQISVRPTATVSEAVSAMAQRRAILVVNDSGKLIGVVSDAVLLRCLLPAYVQVNEPLAGVLDEHAAEELFARVKNRTIMEFIRDVREPPQVAGDDSLIEVASMMLRTASPLVAVVEEGKIIGGISLKDLLYHLAR